MGVNFPYPRINPAGKRAAWLVQQNLEYLAQAGVSGGGSGAFINVKDHGAKADSTTNDTAAFAAAIAEAVDAGGGIVLFPAGSYLGNISITDNVRVLLLGYGATIIPPAGSAAFDIQATNGDQAMGHCIEGFKVDGFSGANTAGLRITNTDFVTFRNFRIQGVTIGVELVSEDGGWVEATDLSNGLIINCGTGLKFNTVPGGNSSFGETLISQVGINNCVTGINVTPDSSIYRSVFEVLTIWLGSDQTGVLMEGFAPGAIWHIGMETFPGNDSNTTGFKVTSSAAVMHLLQLYLNFVGNITNKVQVASGNIIVWQEGINRHEFGGAAPYRGMKNYNEWPSVELVTEASGGGGITFGSGAAAPDTWIVREAANLLGTQDQMLIQGGVTTKVKNGAPVDGDVAWATDGTIVADSATLKLWVRLNGTWYRTQLTPA